MEQNKILDIWYKSDIEYQKGLDQYLAGDVKKWRNRNKIFERLMLAKGFIFVGAGMYSTVWRMGGRLYKINSNLNGVNDGFYAWMKACIEHQGNPTLPKFGDLIQIGQRYCVEIEPLHVQFTIQDSYSLYKATQTNRHLLDAVLLAMQTSVNDTNMHNGMKFSLDQVTASLIEDLLDIHGANIMRLNGQPVLNDPIACLFDPIPFVGGVYAKAV